MGWLHCPKVEISQKKRNSTKTYPENLSNIRIHSRNKHEMDSRQVNQALLKFQNKQKDSHQNNKTINGHSGWFPSQMKCLTTQPGFRMKSWSSLQTSVCLHPMLYGRFIKIHEYPLVSVFFGWFGTKLKHILHLYNHGKWLGLKGNDPTGDTPILHEKKPWLWEDPGGSLEAGGSLPWLMKTSSLGSTASSLGFTTSASAWPVLSDAVTTAARRMTRIPTLAMLAAPTSHVPKWGKNSIPYVETIVTMVLLMAEIRLTSWGW